MKKDKQLRICPKSDTCKDECEFHRGVHKHCNCCDKSVYGCPKCTPYHHTFDRFFECPLCGHKYQRLSSHTITICRRLQLERLKILTHKLAPIIPDSFPIANWKVVSPGVIRGTWAEDGNEYEITCPVQLQELIVQLQNCLPWLLNPYKRGLDEGN